ncbi:MAG TPA: type II toxin-antitoxin system VapC family toxin [Terriglobia bacterium]|nr:type II toxin-antitoxin system VapC family toxin [Terriglobia bacterium]
MSIYADTSFVVSLYIPDIHSPEAQERITPEPILFLTPLHRAEWAHALEQHVFRGVIPRAEADRLYHKFEGHRLSGLWAEVDLPERALEVCIELARRHGARLGNRTLDSLHVACALELGAERFWTFDQRQRKLAAAEGLKTA